MKGKCPAVRPYGTPGVRPAVRHGVRCWVQNQNQNQSCSYRLFVVVRGCLQIQKDFTYGHLLGIGAMP